MPGSFSADTVSPAGNHPGLTTGNEKAPTFTRNVGAFRVSNMAVKEGFDFDHPKSPKSPKYPYYLDFIEVLRTMVTYN